MTLKSPEDEKPIKYNYTFQKKHIYKKIVELDSNAKAAISMVRKKSEKYDKCIEYIFKTSSFRQEGVKDPLVFDPLKWIFNLELNGAGVNSKDELKLLWNRHKDKYRHKDNMMAFMALENLYFNSLFGMEHMYFSNSPYLVFFINVFNKEIQPDTIIKGLDFLLLPMSIPVNTTYKCTKIDQTHIYLDGWLSLDEKKLEKLITQKQFKEYAKSYHYSKDFRIDSEIKICFDIGSSSLSSATFKLDINGESNKLKENTYYKIDRNDSIAHNTVTRFKIIDPY